MAISKKEFEKIGELIDSKVTVIVTKEIGSLRLEMNQRFDATDQKIDTVEKNILVKIDEVKQMETEDIQALASDITKIKKKIAFR